MSFLSGSGGRQKRRCSVFGGGVSYSDGAGVPSLRSAAIHISLFIFLGRLFRSKTEPNRNFRCEKSSVPLYSKNRSVRISEKPNFQKIRNTEPNGSVKPNAHRDGPEIEKLKLSWARTHQPVLTGLSSVHRSRIYNVVKSDPYILHPTLYYYIYVGTLNDFTR
ncbi:hypothetical protein BRADI_1g55105v3 [Brachypodium distachyon]|uniref:Uncharacterized protein n=1 Tax=Brachypodium distachyon TaxID=15368 RepID=A0A2K2DRH2_BRADI|nr:hypothetical protein BRADI_1g55105v3 [Brachypodium distachyon]